MAFGLAMTAEQRREALAKTAETAAAKRARAAKHGIPTLSEAVAAFCAACLYSPGEGGSWRDQVRACTAPACPLYPHRPGAADVDLPDDYRAPTLAGVLADARAVHDDADGDPAAEAV